jgi:hypothetical protein
MRENFHIVLETTRHDPLAILGFLLLGAFAVLFFNMHLRLRAAGYKTHAFPLLGHDWRVAGEYLRARKQQGWSPWPGYLLWPCFFLRIAALAAGLFLLPD